MSEVMEFTPEWLSNFSGTMIWRGKCTDANANDLLPGIYRCDRAANTPDDYGVMMHAKTSDWVKAQIFLNQYRGIYIRVMWDSWGSWIWVQRGSILSSVQSEEISTEEMPPYLTNSIGGGKTLHSICNSGERRCAA